MGNASARQIPFQQNPQAYIQGELTKFVIDKQIGDGKFMKTFVARIDGIPAIVKLYLKGQEEDLRPYTKMLTMYLKQLSPQLLPNIMPYQIWTVSARPRGSVIPAFLIRQYFHSSLLDRISTRPFLTLLEKKWIVYQLFKCLKQSHTGTITGGISHGDIKPENIMVTSWNWVVLTDFAPFKPALLPDDDTSNYNLYFSTGKRQACYLAPERFYSRSNVSGNPFIQSAIKSMSSTNILSEVSLSNGQLEDSLLNGVWGNVETTAAHCKVDIFALGCVIAELFRDGDPLFDLSLVLQYRLDSPKADAQVQMRLEKLRGDAVLYELVNSMISKDLNNRKSVVEYISMLDASGWYPPYFKFLNEFFLMQHWTGSTPDDRILLVCDNLKTILEELGLINDDAVNENEMTADEAVEFFGQLFKGTDFTWNDDILREMATKVEEEGEVKKMAEVGRTVSRKSLKISNKKILTTSVQSSDTRRMTSWSELYLKERMNISELIDSTNHLATKLDKAMNEMKEEHIDDDSKHNNNDKTTMKTKRKTGDIFASNRSRSSGNFIPHPHCEGITLILQIICGNLRHVRLPQSRIASLLLLLFFSRHCSSDVVLERLVPFVACCFNDQMGHVRACALRVLACMLSRVDQFPVMEAQLFPKYVFHLLGTACRDSDFVVRIAFAETLADFALASKKFLEYGHLLRQIKLSRMKRAPSIGQSNEDKQKSIPLIEGVYDKELKQLREQFGRWIRECCADSLENTKFSVTVSSIVKRVLLDQILKICLFFGPEDAVDRILPQFLTFLNGREWELRRTFCNRIVDLCSFLGSFTTEQILPLIDNVLFDAEELVVESAVRCLVSLTELNLISTDLGIEKIKLICPLVLSPSCRIRCAILDLIQAVSNRCGPVSTLLNMIPLMQPLLRDDVAGFVFSVKFLPQLLMTPLSKRSYNVALMDKCNKLKQSSGRRQNIERQSTVVSKPKAPNPNVVSDDFGDLLEAIGSDARVAAKAPGKPNRMSSKTDAKVVKKHNSISQSGSTDANPILTAGISQDELNKIAILDECIVNCARECNQREIQWLESSQKPSTKGGRPLALDGSSVMLEAASALGLSHTKVISVPSHKIIIDQTVSEEARYMTNKRLVYIMDDLSLIRKLYNFTAHADTFKPDVGPDGIGVNDLNDVTSTPADAVSANPNMATGRYQQSTLYPRAVARKIVALNIPPLPSDYGPLIQADGRKFSSYAEGLNLDSSSDPQNRADWRPKNGLLVFSTNEHTQSVNRLVVTMDHTYFASASSDSTVKIWQLRGMDRVVSVKSSLTYAQHTDAITDLTVIENSHSIASASSDGSLHIWRVDMAVSATQAVSAVGGGISGLSQTRTTMQSTSTIRKIDKVEEGPITSVQHYSSDYGSFLVYTTQMGNIHSWDLRMDKDASVMNIGPELGNITTSSIGSDRNWICVGTSKGYVALYDLRFGIMFGLWRHSSCGPIQRLAISRNLPKKTLVEAQTSDGSYLFMSAGNNEASVFQIPDGGVCIRCFRSIPLQNEYLLGTGLSEYHSHLPSLDLVDLPSHPMGLIQSALFDTGPKIMVTDSQMPVHSVRAIMGRVSQNSVSYLMTAGTDRSIRFWDFTTPVKCYSVCGVDAGQPKPTFDSPYLGSRAPHGRLFVCHDSSVPTNESSEMSPHLPQREFRGPRAPATHHQDTIMDLKTVDLPFRMMISCSKDGAIKGWR